jgi:hypothetical protein
MTLPPLVSDPLVRRMLVERGSAQSAGGRIQLISYLSARSIHE